MRTLPLAVAAAAVLGAPALAQVVNAPCFEQNLGTLLALGDDAVAANNALGFTFPGPGGTPVTSIDISSNGFLWLGSNPSSRCCSGNAVQFVADPASIAAAWADLYPPGAAAGAGVFFNSIPGSGSTPSRAVITWYQVPEFGGTNTVTAQIQLLATGEIVIANDPTSSIQWHDVLVGVTQGNNATLNPIDFSQLTAPVNTNTNPTIHEEFLFGTFDLAGRSYEFIPNGVGGYLVLERSACRYASFDTYGSGCPTPAVIYELFQPGTYDLGNVDLTFQPNGQNGYVVLPGSATYVDPTRAGSTAANLLLTDDSIAPNLTLPFPFIYSGGVTNAIDVSSNGCVYLVPGTILDSRCCSGDELRFATETASIAAFWQDLNPTNGGAVYFETDLANQAVYVTWHQVPEYLATGSNSVQVALFSSGVISIRALGAANANHVALVGFSSGTSPTVPVSRDFTATIPFNAGAAGLPLQLDAAPGSRPVLATTFNLDITSIPAGTQVGLLLLGFGRVDPGLDLTPLGMPGCYRYVSLDVMVAFFPTGAGYQFPIGIPNSTVLIGTNVYCQAATQSPGFTPLGFIASNGGVIGIGR